MHRTLPWVLLYLINASRRASLSLSSRGPSALVITTSASEYCGGPYVVESSPSTTRSASSSTGLGRLLEVAIPAAENPKWLYVLMHTFCMKHMNRYKTKHNKLLSYVVVILKFAYILPTIFP
jgi:hypothetical protein